EAAFATGAFSAAGFEASEDCGCCVSEAVTSIAPRTGTQNQRISTKLTTKRGARRLPGVECTGGSELEAQAKLQIPHRTTEFQAGDLARLAAGAVNATAVAWILVLTEARNYVVEQVKRFHA